MIKIITTYAIRNLLRTRLRSFFTLSSITLIILLYSVLSSIGHSFSEQMTLLMKDQSIDLVVQAKHASYPILSIISRETSDGIARLDGVDEIHSVLIAHKRLKGKKSIIVLGLTNFSLFSQHLGFSVIDGRPAREKQKEVLIGEKAAISHGYQLGDEIELKNGEIFSIVGVYSSWLGFLNSGVISDLESIQKVASKPDKASLLFIKLNNPLKTSSKIDEINALYPDMIAIESQQLPNHLGPLKSIFYFAEIVSVMTIMIACAVLVTTIIMAISERTREIGILKAIGWPRSMIVSVFLVESLVLSFFGGLAGYLSSYAVFPILQRVFTSILAFLPNSPPTGIFINIIAMCLVISMVSALFPAFHGTKIQAAKAIHHE